MEDNLMAVALQIICSLLIIGAMIFFLKKNDRSKTGATKGQLILAGWQILFCGWFFALCISDALDFNVNFSSVRFTLNIFYSIAFLSIGVYTLLAKHRKNDKDLKAVIFAFIVLIAVQCFVFPYETKLVFWRIFESVEGAVVFGLLIAVLLKLDDEGFSRKSLLIATILEFIVAIENVAIPMSSITDDFQLVDIPLNYASLFMRPVLFSSLTLVYSVWRDGKK